MRLSATVAARYGDLIARMRVSEIGGAATFQERPIHRPRQLHQGMVHVDDLIEPGAKQILFARLPPFPWPHVEVDPGNRTKR